MSYTKQTWTNGETITDTKLNHMEDGIANGGNQIEYLHLDDTANPRALDKTYGEIKALLDAGKMCIVVESFPYNDEGGVGINYSLIGFNSDGDGTYLITSTGCEFAWGTADEYPTESLD